MKINIGPYKKDDTPRKEDIHIHEYDTWNMDHTLALIILPMLEQLRATKHGVPVIDYEDMPEDLQYIERKYDQRARTDMIDQLQPIEYDDLSEHEFQRQIKCWDWILDEMIWAFSEHTKDYDQAEGKFHTGDPDFISIPIDKEGNEVAEEDADYYRLEYGPNNTSHFDKEGYRTWLDRKQNGFRLFGKYYTALWD